LTNTYEEHSYTSDSTIITKNYKPRIRQEHGEYLLKQLNQVWVDEDQRKAMFASIQERQGTYIEVKGAENCDLLFKSLESAMKKSEKGLFSLQRSLFRKEKKITLMTEYKSIYTKRPKMET